MLARRDGASSRRRPGAALPTDVGPVIDAEARDALERHIERMRARGRTRAPQARDDADARRAHGTFVAPTLIELDRIAELEREVFGPVLHVRPLSRATSSTR